MSSARLYSLEKLVDFQAALATFAHQAKEALSAVEMDFRRTEEWLEERLANWNAEVQRSEEAVFKARQELALQRMIRIGEQRANTTEQEIVLAKARQRLAHAEDKRAACRRWLRDLPDAIADYQSRAVNYQSILEGDVPRMTAFLDRKMDLLEAYAQVAHRDAPPRGGNP